MRESRRLAREQIPNRKHYRVPAMPPITLGEMQEGETKWVWAYCEAFSRRWWCSHHAPIALAPYVIRWGADASGDVLRRNLRCSMCGSRGASLKVPSFRGAEAGPSPWPEGEAAIVAICPTEDLRGDSQAGGAWLKKVQALSAIQPPPQGENRDRPRSEDQLSSRASALYAQDGPALASAHAR
jgi:hypothetical protein